MSRLNTESEIEFSIPAIRVRQPIGEFFVGAMPSGRICDIADFDVRRIVREREVETYLGIQRPLSDERVNELQEYVRTLDACFPSSIILAVERSCAEFDHERGLLKLRNNPNPQDGTNPVLYRSIARVLDGQHRIAGLAAYDRDDFDVNVSIFVDMDLEDQAYVFSTVNLSQTKVNKSLAYDLVELSKARSPAKTCHNVAVALDRTPRSPFFQRIKRLGTATPGREGERLTQATFVEALMQHVSNNPMRDRDILRRKRRLEPSAASDRLLAFRPLFLREQDLVIAEIVMNFFNAVRTRWPSAWNSNEKGVMLARTNGFRAFMRIVGPLYQRMGREVPSSSDFASSLTKIPLSDGDFTTERFKPGGAGETDLYKVLSKFL